MCFQWKIDFIFFPFLDMVELDGGQEEPVVHS